MNKGGFTGAGSRGDVSHLQDLSLVKTDLFPEWPASTLHPLDSNVVY